MWSRASSWNLKHSPLAQIANGVLYTHKLASWKDKWWSTTGLNCQVPVTHLSPKTCRFMTCHSHLRQMKCDNSTKPFRRTSDSAVLAFPAADSELQASVQWEISLWNTQVDSWIIPQFDKWDIDTCYITSYSYHIHIIFISYSYHIHIIFISCSYHIHFIFISYSYHIHIIFISYSYHIHIIYHLNKYV